MAAAPGPSFLDGGTHSYWLLWIYITFHSYTLFCVYLDKYSNPHIVNDSLEVDAFVYIYFYSCKKPLSKKVHLLVMMVVLKYTLFLLKSPLAKVTSRKSFWFHKLKTLYTLRFFWNRFVIYKILLVCSLSVHNLIIDGIKDFLSKSDTTLQQSVWCHL